MSIEYYNQHAQSFFDGTLSVEMSSIYQHFEPHLPTGALILDAGCGSGRDSLYFLRQGFSVIAMDASHELAHRAAVLTGLPVQICRFEEFEATTLLDGIWACASLLHVPESELSGVMGHLASQLNVGGLFYCSFKYGNGEISREGRTFTHLDEAGLDLLLQILPLRIQDVWQTGDLRPGREHERWLNAVLIRAAL